METVEEYRANLKQCYMILTLIKDWPLQEMLDMHSRSQSLGPILYPTEFRNADHVAVRQDSDVIQILREAQAKFARFEAQAEAASKERLARQAEVSR